ncbi:hypothetical protein FO519_002820 [Halicephalobus sp. NKZ332]|nr:hypothetical protein FO519_002820 [Halicephalobus sp. NKZ332]
MVEVNSQLVFLVAVVAISFGVYNKLQRNAEDIAFVKQELSELEERLRSLPKPSETLKNSDERPVALIGGISISPDDPVHLSHVEAVFRRLGYRTILSVDNFLSSGLKDFDVFWNHEYPFSNSKLRPLVENPKAKQKVNHVPGSGYYSSKVQLATANLSLGVPLAFRLPDQKAEFIKYSKENPSIQWVQKSNAHRNIKVLLPDQINLDKPETFVQKFVEDPLLIDNKKFDIGIYTVITSISPLRVYIYEGDALIRFCGKEYEPFDPEDVDRYVVGDDYTPVWEMPSLKELYNERKFTFKSTLNFYLKKIGKHPEIIWTQIREIIRQVFESQNSNMISAAKNYKNLRSYFELSRFDFVVDTNLNVYLMEANMSPNLSTGHFIQNRLLYEQVIFNILSLIGLANRVDSDLGEEAEEMLVSDRDVYLGLPECEEEKCSSCEKSKLELCRLCPHCLTDDFRKTLKATFLEQLNRQQMRRLFPRNPDDEQQPQRPEDKILSLWFREKCKANKVFCD